MYYFKNATKGDFNTVINFKLKTILESDYDKTIDNEERKKIEDYVIQTTNEHINKYKLIILNNQIIGVFLIYEYEDGILLDQIYLIDKFRKKGIGFNIISDIIKNHSKVYLWVYKSNSKAIKLYEKLNFKIIAETETRYKMLYK